MEPGRFHKCYPLKRGCQPGVFSNPALTRVQARTGFSPKEKALHGVVSVAMAKRVSCSCMGAGEIEASTCWNPGGVWGKAGLCSNSGLTTHKLDD